jgi:hypothetical protein
VFNLHEIYIGTSSGFDLTIFVELVTLSCVNAKRFCTGIGCPNKSGGLGKHNTVANHIQLINEGPDQTLN